MANIEPHLRYRAGQAVDSLVIGCESKTQLEQQISLVSADFPPLSVAECDAPTDECRAGNTWRHDTTRLASRKAPFTAPDLKKPSRRSLRYVPLPPVQSPREKNRGNETKLHPHP